MNRTSLVGELPRELVHGDILVKHRSNFASNETSNRSRTLPPNDRRLPPNFKSNKQMNACVCLSFSLPKGTPSAWAQSTLWNIMKLFLKKWCRSDCESLNQPIWRMAVTPRLFGPISQLLPSEPVRGTAQGAKMVKALVGLNLNVFFFRLPIRSFS